MKKRILKIDKVVECFPQYMDLLYPDQEPDKNLAASVVVNHLLFANTHEMNVYVRRFFALHAKRYNIFTDSIDQKEAIVSFLKLVQSKLPDNIDLICPRLNVFLSNVTDELVNNIINFCKIKDYSKDHVSFVDILYGHDAGIKSPQTLKRLIKKLDIKVISLNEDYKNGKFITHQDHQKILQAYRPR